ncbi:hypothetical protein ACT7C1_11465 [Bacillus paranthracis]
MDAYESDENKNVLNLLENLYVHVSSSAIKRNGSFLIGKRAMQNSEKNESDEY